MSLDWTHRGLLKRQPRGGSFVQYQGRNLLLVAQCCKCHLSLEFQTADTCADEPLCICHCSHVSRYADDLAAEVVCLHVSTHMKLRPCGLADVTSCLRQSYMMTFSSVPVRWSCQVRCSCLAFALPAGLTSRGKAVGNCMKPASGFTNIQPNADFEQILISKS